MAKVPLRKYNREIESLIEHGQTDEAIAHCRHVLKTFPKAIETYRLLGKAYLESKRHSEASDIFNRILMAVPDDFVSHVGLSIIADDQKRLEDAIWHMERAFEKQPSNAAIQAELQRLYGRRDGREPPKIRLNRGALAHMYYQGELFMQAVSEIRSVLAEDPSRADLQSLLALSYFRAGQKVEASEICSNLIGQFPYNLDANRVLVEILPGTNMASDANIYRQRVVELDPYAAHTAGSILQSAEVADEAVSLEYLDYKGKPVEPSPEWSKSLGIGLTGTTSAAPETPEWLKKEMDSIPHSAVPHDFKEEEQPGLDFQAEQPQAETAATPQEDIPDWMRKAGWGESTGTFDESAVTLADETPAETPSEDIEKADLPDWIKSMAPADDTPDAAASGASISGEQAPIDAETLDWLNKLGGDKPFGSASAGESPSRDLFDEKPADESSQPAPDWLASLEDSSQENPLPAAAADTPAWLSDIGDSELTASVGAASTADWLSKLDDEEDEPASAPSQAIPLDLHPELEPEPEPLLPIMPTDSTPPVQPTGDGGIGSLGTSTADQDAAMLWLESLAAKQGAKSEELISRPEDRLEKPPEWVEQAVEQVRDLDEVQPFSQVPVEEPVEPSIQEPTPEAPKSEPEWSAEELTEAAPSELPEIDRTGIWLNELDEKEVKAEETFDFKSTEWSGEIDITSPAKTKSLTPDEEEEIPAWLRGTDGLPIIPATGTLGGEMPEWLRGDDREVPENTERTQPADWTPEAERTEPPTQPAPAKPAPVKPEPVIPELKPEPKPQPKTEFKFDLKPEPTVEAKPEPRLQPKPPVRLEPKPQAKPAPKTEVTREDLLKARRNGMLPTLVDPMLAAARDYMSRGKIPDALQAYDNLIRKGRNLEDITFDLKEALYRFPVEVSIWQTLGDVYMRSNRLQDALDAYTKAEELLR
jgi:tetratricopeptide (TPR) repeat protein